MADDEADDDDPTEGIPMKGETKKLSHSDRRDKREQADRDEGRDKK